MAQDGWTFLGKDVEENVQKDETLEGGKKETGDHHLRPLHLQLLHRHHPPLNQPINPFGRRSTLSIRPTH